MRRPSNKDIKVNNQPLRQDLLIDTKSDPLLSHQTVSLNLLLATSKIIDTEKAALQINTTALLKEMLSSHLHIMIFSTRSIVGVYCTFTRAKQGEGVGTPPPPPQSRQWG